MPEGDQVTELHERAGWIRIGAKYIRAKIWKAIVLTSAAIRAL
jgi:hypothetical protein